MQVSQRRLKFLPLWDVKTGTDLPAARLVKDKKNIVSQLVVMQLFYMYTVQ